MSLITINVFPDVHEYHDRPQVSFRFLLGVPTPQPATKTPDSPRVKVDRPFHHRGVSPMAFVLKDTDQVEVKLEFFDKKGKLIKNPTLDGIPAWRSSDPAAVSVVPAADGLSAIVAAQGDPEDTATITCTADADLGEGVNEVTTTGDVMIIGGDIATSNMQFGTPSEQA